MKNPMMLMPLINMVGAVSTFIYFSYILPPVTEHNQIPSEYSVLFFLGASLILFLFFFFLRKRSVRELFEVADGRTDIASLEPHDRMYHQREALQLPLTLTAVTFGVWTLAGFIFGFLEPVIVSHVFDIPMENLALCLRRFFGITILGGGVTCIVQFFVLESVWRESLPLFFPDGKLNRITHVFRISIQKRFLLGILGIAFIPLPVLGATILSAIRQIHLADAVTRSQIMSSLFWELLFISLDLIVIACIVAYLLAKTVSVPLENIRTAIQSVENNDLDTRVPILSNDEMGEVAEGVNRMIDSLRESRRAQDAFGLYMGNEIRDAILSGDISLEGEMKRATLLFCDLRNFTGMVESSHPRQIVQILNQYFTQMTRAITDHQGLVLQYVGDEIEAVFGAPVAMDDHPEKAVKAALSMRSHLETLNRTLMDQGYSSLVHGIGIHSGAVLAGNIGSPEKMSYALVGDTVNTASRLEGLTKDHGVDIIISQTTYNLLTGSYCTEQLPPVTVKGKKEGLIIYRLIS
jgi:adenylate cyclase